MVTVALPVIGALTLVPVAPTITLSPTCVVCGPLGGVDLVLNVLLFVPLGIGLGLAVGANRRTIAIGFAVTLMVETVQFLLIPGRFATLGDLITNTLGVGAGAWLVTSGPRLALASGALARRLSLLGSALASLVLGATAALLRQAPAPAGQQVQWAVVRASTEPFPGTLLSVEVNGRPVRSAEPLPSAALIDPVTGETRLRARMTGVGTPTDRQAIVVRTASRPGEGLYLGQWGLDAVFRTSQAASLARFRPLLIRLPNGFAPDRVASDASVAIEATSRRAAIDVRRFSAGDSAVVSISRSIGLGWTLFLPWDVAIDAQWWPANAAWLACLVFPAVFLSVRTGQGWSQVLSRGWQAGALVVGALLVVPHLAGIGPTTSREWLGVALGTLAAVGAARLTRSCASTGA